MDRVIKEIGLELLVPFKMHSGQMYEGKRLRQMMDSIKQSGLINPIIVRPVDTGKYEIICGHNRAKAAKELGNDRILADIRYELSDDEAVWLYYDSNLNQQSFHDWGYAQRIEAVRYIEKLIKENSCQGKRTDLETKKPERQGESTSVQTRHKLDGDERRKTIRDKMADVLGISTATLSKYRSIVKLPDELTDSIVGLLDEKRITFEEACMISKLRNVDIQILVKYINRDSGRRIDINKLKELCARRKGKALFPVLSRNEIKEILISEDTLLIQKRRK